MTMTTKQAHERFPIIKKHPSDDKALAAWLEKYGKKERGDGGDPPPDGPLQPLQRTVEQACDNLEQLADGEDDSLTSVCRTAITVIDDLREVVENSRRVINRLKLNLGYAKCCCECGPGDKCCTRCTRRFTFKQAIEQAKAMIRAIDNAV